MAGGRGAGRISGELVEEQGSPVAVEQQGLPARTSELLDLRTIGSEPSACARLAAAREALGRTDAGAAREPRLTAGGESYGGRELHL